MLYIDDDDDVDDDDDDDDDDDVGEVRAVAVFKIVEDRSVFSFA